MLTRDEPSQLAGWVAVGGEASRFVVVHASRSDWESAERQVRSIRTQFVISIFLICVPIHFYSLFISHQYVMSFFPS